MQRVTRLLPLLPLLLITLASACGDDSADATPATSTEEYAEQAMMACDMIGGNTLPLTASPAIDQVPAADDHAHLIHAGVLYEITVPDGGPGFVSFHCAEAHADWIVFTDAPAAIDNVFDDGVLFDVPSSKANDHCDQDIAGQSKLHFHEAKPYVFEVSGAETIRILVLEGAAGHDDTATDDHVHGG